jgi:cysteine synthase B
MSDIENYIGNTPLVLIDEIGSNKIFGKLEGNNPAGSIKDRPAIKMIKDAEIQGLIKKGDTLIEATSGNTGIALAMAASIRGFKMKLIMPETASIERVKDNEGIWSRSYSSFKRTRHGGR